MREAKQAYIPVPSQDLAVDRDECMEYLNYYMKEKPLAAGGYAKIFEVCTSDYFFRQCPYVAKVQNLSDEKDVFDETKFRKFQLEVAITHQAARKKFGVPIVDAWTCHGRKIGVMILEKWQGSLMSLPRYSLGEEEVASLIALFSKMHNSGIFHQDLFNKNILFRVKGEVYEFAVTDFGLALPLEKSAPPLIRALDIASFFYGFASSPNGRLQGSIRPQLTDEGRAQTQLQDYVSPQDDFLDTAVQWRVNEKGVWRLALGNAVESRPIVTHPKYMYRYLLSELPVSLLRYLGEESLHALFVWTNLDTVPPKEEQAVIEEMEEVYEQLHLGLLKAQAS
jgi:tRNA A-37 threonylcarbamoyl transferase component Bud32